MLVSRRIKSLFKKLKENPYIDGEITCKAILFDLFKEPISMIEDERLYSEGLVKFLNKEALLIEAYSKYERVDRDEDDGPMYYGGNTLYLYQDNLIPVKQTDGGNVAINVYYPTSRKCVIDKFKRYLIEEKGESKVSILVSRNGGLVAQKVSFPAPVIEDLELNYGMGFGKVHGLMVSNLEERRSGIIICHGTSGSGKSTYLKYLTSIIDREFIYIPVGMTQSLTEPSFISLLLGKKECVLILEDAEQAIQQRGSSSSDGAVSTLLNLGDGVLGSLISATIIITYNADRQDVDKAILRRGRLMVEHDFSALSIEDSKRLAKHLGKNMIIKEPMVLADIYCSQENPTHKASELPRQMGFHTMINQKKQDGEKK